MPQPISVRKAKKALRSKGFIRNPDHHEFYFHRDSMGQKTGPYTYFSEGGKKTDYIGPGLLKRIQKELRLGTIQEVADLLNCPMDEEQYITLLRDRKRIR